MTPLIVVCILTATYHFTETFAASMRLAGVRTRQIASSISFLNACLLVTRMSNMVQAPLMGGMVDTSILKGDISHLANNFRFIIFAAFIGNLLAAALIPFAVGIFTKAIKRFERTGSFPGLIIYALSPKGITAVIRNFRLPSMGSLKNLSLKGIPKTFLVLNVIMVSIYAIGVLASLMAGAMIPAYRITAVQLSGLVNGIATILLTIMVDPVAAHITDQAARGKRSENDVRTVVFYIVAGRVFGTLIISQLLFFPAAYYIKSVAVLVKGLF